MRVLLHGELHLGVDYLLDGAGVDEDAVDARCAALAEASGLDIGRPIAWCVRSRR
jgi:hypothetical protein